MSLYFLSLKCYFKLSCVPSFIWQIDRHPTLQTEHLVCGFVLRNCLLTWNYSNGYTHTQTLCTKSEICNSQDAWLIFTTYPGTVKISSVINEIDTPGDSLSLYQTGRNSLKGFRWSPWRQGCVGKMRYTSIRHGLPPSCQQS